MKPIYATAAILSFLLALGTIGGIEHNLIPTGRGLIICVLFMTAWVGCTYLAGGFNAWTGRK